MTPIDVRITWMMKDDMRDVLAIERDCFPFPWTEDDFIKSLRCRHVVGITAKNEFGRNIGYAVYELRTSKIELMNLAVDRICQRRRIGTQLINYLKRKLIDRRPRITAEVIDTNLPAHLFFRANSFKAVRVNRDAFTDENDDKRDSYSMSYQRPPLFAAPAEAACEGCQ